jgi:hypothetical protein
MEIKVSNCCGNCPFFNWDGEQMWFECKVLPGEGKDSSGIYLESNDHPDNSIIFPNCPLKSGSITVELSTTQFPTPYTKPEISDSPEITKAVTELNTLLDTNILLRVRCQGLILVIDDASVRSGQKTHKQVLYDKPGNYYTLADREGKEYGTFKRSEFQLLPETNTAEIHKL